jgi:threonylcarbamoyladenosine tRNA methylthiotransferase MtaB
VIDQEHEQLHKVSKEIIKKRKDQVLRLSEEMALQLREKFVSRKMKVLTESRDATRPGIILGHTENFLTVLVNSDDIASNELIHVELLSNSPEGLIGRYIY